MEFETGNLKPETGKSESVESGCLKTDALLILLLPHAEHDAGGGAGAVHGYGVVYFAEREGVGDEAVEGHFTGFDEVDEAGNFKIWGCATAVGAFEDFFEVEW